MISKTNRFKHRFSVQAVYKNSQTVRGPMMSLKYSQKGNKPWRLAVVVSKKVSKSAVKRNRIRRRIYERFRHWDDLIPDGTDIILTVFDDKIGDIKPDELDKILSNLVKKIK